MKKHLESPQIIGNLFTLLLLLTMFHDVVAKTNPSDILIVEKPQLIEMGLFSDTPYVNFATIKELPDNDFSYLKLFYTTEQMETILYLPDFFYNEIKRKVDNQLPGKILLNSPENWIYRITLKSGIEIEAESVLWEGFNFITSYHNQQDTIRTELFHKIEVTEPPKTGLEYESKSNAFEHKLFVAQTARKLDPFTITLSSYEFYIPSATVALPLNLTFQALFLPYVKDDDGNIPYFLSSKITLIDLNEYQLAMGSFHYEFNYELNDEDVKFPSFNYVAQTFRLGRLSPTIGFGSVKLDRIYEDNVLYLGAELDVGSGFKLLGEHWTGNWDTMQNGIGLLGTRMYTEKLSFELAMFYYSVEGKGMTFFDLPVFTFSYRIH